jgi:lipopolysaccharide export LptBFGC system permease protein LptF
MYNTGNGNAQFGEAVRMLLCNLALCEIIALLSLGLLSMRRAGQITGILMSLLSVFAMSLFLSIQRASGNPDAGRQIVQIYFPVMIFMAFGITGGICSTGMKKSYRTLRL